MGRDMGVLGIAHLPAGRAKQLVNGLTGVFLRLRHGRGQASLSVLDL